jgi:2,5-diketo-D-gluconate reductase A
VRAALAAGVAHVDTAEAYRNEAAVGRAWRDSGRPRDAVFLATKLSRGESHGYGEALALVAAQLELLQTDYVDLYYIHG